jgi:hypothetical protein
MLRDGLPNPLTVHGIREAEYCSPHFTKVQFNLRTTNKQITDWIWENLEGRFWYGDWYFIADGGSCSMNSCAAFESPGESSMFALCLDQFNKGQY